MLKPIRMKTATSNYANRPTKLARGMQYTADRSAHKLGPLGNPERADRIRLCVRGTLDELRGVQLLTRATRCPCCRAMTGPRVLNEHGKRKLRMLRARMERKQ